MNGVDLSSPSSSRAVDLILTRSVSEGLFVLAYKVSANGREARGVQKSTEWQTLRAGVTIPGCGTSRLITAFVSRKENAILRFGLTEIC